jgi:hypothetical protein
MTEKNFDPKCGDLANHFLPLMTTNKLRDQLAQYIQDAIEDWLNELDVDDLKDEEPAP